MIVGVQLTNLLQNAGFKRVVKKGINWLFDNIKNAYICKTTEFFALGLATAKKLKKNIAILPG